MIKLTIKDADKIIKYLREKLKDSHDQIKTRNELKQVLLNHSNPLIEVFLDNEEPNEKSKDEFIQFSLSQLYESIKEVEKEISEIENCILLLTTGSEEE